MALYEGARGGCQMRGFVDLNPGVIFIYYLLVCGIVMFSMNPFLILFSFIGSVFIFFSINKTKDCKINFFFLLMFIVLTIINPLFSHNGKTVLFVLNNNPITLESLLYGMTSSLMIITVIYWFRSFSMIMTSDRLLYVFGKISPKISLLISMTLRYIPLFSKQTGKINQTQTAMGLYREDNIIDDIKGGTRVFSVMVTWALENGIITADSMVARGYGIGKRSHFSIFKFKENDILFLGLSLSLSVITIIGITANSLEFDFYPKISMNDVDLLSVVSISAYALLALMPVLIEWKESLRWKYLESKI